MLKTTWKKSSAHYLSSAGMNFKAKQKICVRGSIFCLVLLLKIKFIPLKIFFNLP